MEHIEYLSKRLACYADVLAKWYREPYKGEHDEPVYTLVVDGVEYHAHPEWIRGHDNTFNLYIDGYYPDESRTVEVMSGDTVKMQELGALIARLARLAPRHRIMHEIAEIMARTGIPRAWLQTNAQTVACAYRAEASLPKLKTLVDALAALKVYAAGYEKVRLELDGSAVTVEQLEVKLKALIKRGARMSWLLVTSPAVAAWLKRDPDAPKQHVQPRDTTILRAFLLLRARLGQVEAERHHPSTHATLSNMGDYDDDNVAGREAVAATIRALIDAGCAVSWLAARYPTVWRYMKGTGNLPKLATMQGALHVMVSMARNLSAKLNKKYDTATQANIAATAKYTAKAMADDTAALARLDAEFDTRRAALLKAASARDAMFEAKRVSSENVTNALLPTMANLNRALAGVATCTDQLTN